MVNDANNEKPGKGDAGAGKQSWWQQPLDSLNHQQWEQLCDGCGKCCLHKLQDEDTNDVFFTAIACDLLDSDSVRCSSYADRAQRNPGCLIISPENIKDLVAWLPATCAYRLRFFGQRLYDWHPLLSGSPDSVEAAGHSVRHRVVKEKELAGNQNWQELILVDLV